MINSVSILRVSSKKQGMQGDSPAEQLKDVIIYAQKIGISPEEIKEFELWQSGSGEIQPATPIIAYCKQNKIKYCFISRIDRFTRGGSKWYLTLRDELRRNGTQLLDAQGIISKDRGNTMAKHGLKYSWSDYNPSEASEIQKAEEARAKIVQDISNMISAEVGYSELGYVMQGRRYGYMLIKKETGTKLGKKPYLQPIKEEAKYLKMMFELTDEKRLSPAEIVDEINSFGYKSRRIPIRHPDIDKKHIIIGYRGEVPLTVKQMNDYLQNPIYACVLQVTYKGNLEGRKKITAKAFGERIISIELWNRVNQGKKMIIENPDGTVEVIRGKIEDHLLFKNVYSDLYPFKPVILCPICRSSLHASASTGKGGKPRPAYHCTRKINGVRHNFRVKLSEFNEVVTSFIKNVKMTDEAILKLKVEFLLQYEDRRKQAVVHKKPLDKMIEDNQAEQEQWMIKIDSCSLPSLIARYEDKIAKLELQQKLLQKARNKQEEIKTDSQVVINTFWYWLEHLDELIINADNPTQTSKLFALLFTTLPTYEDLVVGTPNLARVFELKSPTQSSMYAQRDSNPRPCR